MMTNQFYKENWPQLGSARTLWIEPEVTLFGFAVARCGHLTANCSCPKSDSQSRKRAMPTYWEPCCYWHQTKDPLWLWSGWLLGLSNEVLPLNKLIKISKQINPNTWGHLENRNNIALKNSSKCLSQIMSYYWKIIDLRTKQPDLAKVTPLEQPACSSEKRRVLLKSLRRMDWGWDWVNKSAALLLIFE